MGSTKVSDIEKDIYSTFAEISSSIGYSEIHGRILACLLVAEKSLSLQEVAKETGYSASTISLSLDVLEFLDMIKKFRKVGDRKLYLKLNGNLLEGLKRAIIIKIDKSVGDSLEKFEGYEKDLEKCDETDRKRVMRSLKIIKNEVDKLNKYVGMLNKIKLK